MSGSGDSMDTEIVKTPDPSGTGEAHIVTVDTTAGSAHADDTNPLIFDISDVSVYYGDFRAVRDVTIPIRENEITALIGPSGCGKTTVLRSFNRMNDLIEGARVEGSVLYHGIALFDRARDPVEG